MVRGWRLKIGLLLPAGNTTMEPEFYEMVPQGVTVHTSRMWLTSLTPKGLKKMADDAPRAAKYLSQAGVDVVVYGCTSGSLIGGVGWEKRLVESIVEKVKIPTITTASAVVNALKQMEVRKVVIATPYPQEINKLEKQFLEENGIKVLNIRGVLGSPISSHPPWVPYKLSKEIFDPQSDGVFISCTDFRTIEIIEKLERDLGRPVITSNQASLWATLRTGKIQETIKGYGRLLEGGFEYHDY